MSKSDTDIIKDIEHRVRQFVTDNDLPQPGSRLIAGLSGGADSTALVAILVALGYDVVAAHCNFRLRGDESLRDSRHAREVARLLDIDIHVRNFDVPGRMAATGESLEMACRSLRYDWFLSLLDKHRARAVAIGHHSEDNAETLMLNMLRGTGIAGLGGIRPRRDYVIRPLLDLSRADIESYLRARQITWVDDSSNATDAFKRNALRLNIIPSLESNFPGASAAIVRTARNVASAAALYDIAVKRLASPYCLTGADGLLRVAAARIADDFGHHAASSATTLLFETIRHMGFGSDTAEAIMRAMAAGRTGRRFDSPTHRAWLDRGVLIIQPSPGHESTDVENEVSLARDILAPVHIEITEHPISDFAPKTGDNSSLYLDVRVIEGSPRFTLRPWRRGDRIEPFGMNGKSRLVSDIFTDAHLSPHDKERVLLLCRNDVPMWVVGLRASRHFAITPSTRRYLRLHLC